MAWLSGTASYLPQAFCLRHKSQTTSVATTAPCMATSYTTTKLSQYLTNLTNSRVRSTHPFHTKPPFPRFGGGRRQKSENIVVSARGRRTPQAPTLRTSGCANARKYDYKSSSLYAQSTKPSQTQSGNFTFFSRLREKKKSPRKKKVKKKFALRAKNKKHQKAQKHPQKTTKTPKKKHQFFFVALTREKNLSRQKKNLFPIPPKTE